MRQIVNLSKVSQEARWTSTHTAIVEYVLKQLSANTELLLPDVSRPFVLEVDYTDKGFGRVLP